MPRGRKKLTPEELKQQFDIWKESSEEYKLIEQLKDIKNTPGLTELTETSMDLIEKWQPFFDLLVKVGTVFKVRGTKMKPIQQEQLRTAFFGGVIKRDEEPFWIDGMKFEYTEKDIPKCCRHVRNCMVEFSRFIEEIDVIDENTYNDWKKQKISAKYKDFVKFFKEHIKKDKGHVQTKKIMVEVLQSLQDLMEANIRLTLFDFEFESELKYEQNNYKYKALIESWCKTYQNCQFILETHVPTIVKCNPDIYSTLKKFQYENWRDNTVEKYYIKPLQDSWLSMRVNLTKLYSMGFDFWKQPLSENAQFRTDVVDLIEKENRAEILMGNKLSRFQLNFLFNIIGIIYRTPSKAKLLSATENIMEKTIPELAIQKAAEQMHDVFSIKLDELREKKDFDHYSIQTPPKLLDFALMSAKEPDKCITHEDLLPPGMIYNEKFMLVNGEEIEVKINDNDLNELEKYSRFLVWPDFLPEDKHKEMLEASKLLRIINKAVVQDLEDFIITTGMEPSGTFYLQHKKEALADQWALTKMQNAERERKVFENRPPNLWNEPTSLMDKHEFKCSANPTKIYTDSRVTDLYDIIKSQGTVIKTHEKGRWKNLVEKIIDVYKAEEEGLEEKA